MVMDNIRRSRHPRILVHYTVNRENIDDIPRLAEHLASRGRVRGMTFQFFYPYGQGEADLTLDERERAYAVDVIVRLKRSGTLPVLNSAGCLRRMIKNDWICRPWMIANVDPDGIVGTGCYVARRGTVRCTHCGFTPVAELSRSYSLHPESLFSGWRTLLRGPACVRA